MSNSLVCMFIRLVFFYTLMKRWVGLCSDKTILLSSLICYMTCYRCTSTNLPLFMASTVRKSISDSHWNLDLKWIYK